MLIQNSDPDRLLVEINQELSRRNLKPLGTLGGITQEEPMIVGVIDIVDGMKEYVTDVIYWVHWPGGQGRKPYVVHYHAGSALHDGLVAITLINGRLAIVKQFRVPTMKWTHEVPRGFANINELEADKGVDEAVMRRLLQRELGRRLMREAEVQTVTSLGHIDSDTGFSAMSLEYVLAELAVDEDEVRRRQHTPEEGVELYLWNGNTLRRELFRKLRDVHSVTAVMLLRERTKWFS